jgi:hypothetical protein
MGVMPAEPVMFCSEMSVGAFVPGKMKSSPGGILAHAVSGSPKFLSRTSLCGRCQYTTMNLENTWN